MSNKYQLEINKIRITKEQSLEQNANRKYLKKEELESITLFRYVDLWKFLDLIETGELFFPSIQSFNDPFEGITEISFGEKFPLSDDHQQKVFIDQPPLENKEVNDFFNKTGRRIDPNDNQRVITNIVDEYLASIRNSFPEDLQELQLTNSKPMDFHRNRLRLLYPYVYASCWFRSSMESFLRWRAYTNMQGSIAIKTNASKLINSFQENTLNKKTIQAKASSVLYWLPAYGKMESEDRVLHHTHELFSNNCKRPYFEDEKEVRIVTDILQTQDLSRHGGLRIKIDLAELLEEIILCPNSPESLRNSLDRILKSKLLNVKISKSNLDMI